MNAWIRTTPCLIAEHVQKRYGKTYALEDASLDLHPGEILALLGPNGAGKTTLIKILGTLLTKDAGRVEIMGCDLDREAETIRHLCGYVGQDSERSAYARLTVLENLRFFGALRGMSRRQVDRQVEKMASVFDFTSNLGKLFVTLSGGQKQTVVIMRAFLHDPPLIFLDEPTKGLDPIIARKIRSFLKQVVRQEGKSLLLTSHILPEVDELADRVALIHRGKIPVVGTSGQLKSAIGVMEFVEIQEPLPEATLERILGLEAVVDARRREPGWISFGVTDAMEGAEAIIAALRQAEVQTGFRHHSVSLEDAFLHHIGEIQEKFEQ